ncbi:MAG: Oxidoreductase, GMC family [Rhodanobacteraceae bacterium]|jgi:choline dehydrogenase|nr:MAG: Oxidoreductase, GMC family [Rhodanobacteraceae bacterium]
MDFDYIIIGAGSAGCVLAARLSADPARRVLVLEAGPRDWHPFIHMPAGLARLARNRRINWDYSTEPQPQLGNRVIWWPRGKVLGGSSSINAMCYIRGTPADYDGWTERTGDSRWAWNNVLPYFKRAERNSRGADAWHGGDGPLDVSDLRHVNPLTHAFVEAGTQMGLARNDDFNGSTQVGVGLYQVTQRDGVRCSAAVAYLDPVKARRNLRVVTGALTTRITFDRTSRGRPRANGVECTIRGRSVHFGAREVIVCGGTINSPQLLMLSGIGDTDALRRLGIDATQHLPGVGTNLQDHLDVCTLQHETQRTSYDRASEVKTAFDYYLRGHRGPGTSNIAEGGAFLRSRLATDDRADIQLHFIPAMIDDHGRRRLPGDGYTLHACFLRPRSRGRITLASNRAADKPRIEANYLGDEEGFDLKMLIECAKVSLDLLARPAFDRYRGAPIHPARVPASDAEWSEFVRTRAETVYHPVGTCRMGRDDGAVVDPELRVHGVDGLRVVDASVMPVLPSGNTNAPTIMLAELASDLILGRPARSDQPA